MSKNKALKKINLPHLELLGKITLDYENLDIDVRSVFEYFTDKYYHENFHSKLLGFYLEFKDVQKEFFKWLAKQKAIGNEKKIDIEAADYIDGKVEIEKNKFDISLYSKDNSKIIFFENKSNYAKDQDNQIPRYVEKAEKDCKTVEAVIYITVDKDKEPEYSTWKVNVEDKQKIKDKLICTHLYEEDGFQEFFKQVQSSTTDKRLYGLSEEIKLLFNNISKEKEINKKHMEIYEELQKEGLKSKTLYESMENIKNIYDELPNLTSQAIYEKAINKEFGAKLALITQTEQVYNFFNFYIPIRGNKHIIIECQINYENTKIYFAYWNGNARNKNKEIKIFEKLKDRYFKNKWKKIEIKDESYWWGENKKTLEFYGYEKDISINQYFCENNVKTLIKEIEDIIKKFQKFIDNDKETKEIF